MSFADPIGNIDQFQLKEGMKVADLGAGVGAYTVPLCKKVGDTGRVYAVEVQKDLLGTIQSAVADAGLGNAELLWGDIENVGGTKIVDHGVDAVVLANVLFQTEDKAGVLAEVRRILVPGGKVLFVDWKDSYGGIGPQPEHVFRADQARILFEANGFEFERSIDTGSQHYGFVLVKN